MPLALRQSGFGLFAFGDVEVEAGKTHRPATGVAVDMSEDRHPALPFGRM